MIGKRSETRAVSVLLFITVIICITGVLLYKNLSSVSKDVSSSYNYETTPSLIIRQILVEIRDAETCVKSYNLTHSQEYLIPFYTSVSLVDKKLTELENSKKHDHRERVIIDSIVLLCEARFELLKKQLYLDDEKKITDELNAISSKIKESYINGVDKESTLIVEPEKESFFKRIFGKKKKNTDTLERTVEQLKQTEKQLSQIAGELKTTIQKVKASQLEKLQERQLLELQLAGDGKIVNDRLRLLYAEIENKEQQFSLKKIELAKAKVNTIKSLSIIVSVVLSLLLLLISYFIVNYTRKKKEYELALLQARQNAEDLAKTKEMFLANMSHEIKTPLNAIYGFTEQVLNSDLNNQQKEQLGIVKKSANHLIKLISDILNYSRIQSGKVSLEKNDLNIKDELQEIELLFKQQTNAKGIQLIVEIDGTVPDIINCDLTKFKQILFNLLGNAIKFTDEGFVKLKVVKSENPSNNTPCLLISVTDTGIGIAESKIPKLFNEYEQADTAISKKYGGTGLGLVITKKILEQMGGTIELQSTEHKGTEIKIALPYEKAIDPNFSNNNEKTSGLNLKLLSGKEILIVDDQEFNRLLLKAILSKHGVNVSEARNGLEAVEMVTSNNYNAILMDVNMPIKNGIEACREIRRINKKQIANLPILASTAVMASDDKTKECMDAGFNGFVHKPFTEKSLLETLNHFLNKSDLQKFIPSNPVVTNSEADQKIFKKLNFENIIQASNGDDVFKKEMIGIFYKSINSSLLEIEGFAHSRKWVQASEVAHKNMPACKHFEADNLYSILKYFENLRGQDPEISTLSIKLKELRSEVEEINNQLKLYL